jgi:hypothetical protein
VLAGVVVAELLDHADREREHAVALLEPVDGPQQVLDPLHRVPRSAAVTRLGCGRGREAGKTRVRVSTRPKR